MLWRHSNHYSVLPIILLEVEILHYPIDWQRREGRKRILNMNVFEQQGGKGIFPRCPIGPHTETCATPWTTTLLLHIKKPFLSFSFPPCCLITITVNGSMHFIMRKWHNNCHHINFYLSLSSFPEYFITQIFIFRFSLIRILAI